MRYKILSFLFLLPIAFQGQSSIKLMQYNLLYYDKEYNDCNTTSNNVNTKNEALKLIINQVEPDILCVNEMNAASNSVNLLLDEVMNADGRNYYAAADWTGSFLINAMYYDTRKLEYLDHSSFSFSVGNGFNRYMDIYYMNALTEPEPTPITFITAHLKAGSGTEEANLRAQATSLLAENIELHYDIGENFIFSGDFNFYDADETGYQNLINNSNSQYRFYDPVDASGAWNNNAYFANYHTQSTHTSGGCPSGGGLDDRFDFILVSPAIKNRTAGVYYQDGDYVTVGQDGEHFNSSVNYGYNSSVSNEVADALYLASDHLPVSLKLRLDKTISFAEEFSQNITYTNPVKETLKLKLPLKNPAKYKLSIYSSSGKPVFTKQLSAAENEISMQSYPAGIYFLRIEGINICRTFKLSKI